MKKIQIAFLANIFFLPVIMLSCSLKGFMASGAGGGAPESVGKVLFSGFDIL
jgi:hypothetical protein